MEDRAGEVANRSGAWWPELLVVATATASFFFGLGRIELWGRREERVAAEAVDTLRQGHWLVARLQGRPRLRKPPLARWCSAAALWATGRQDEWSLRLPYALAAVAAALLVYGWGRRLGGRLCGLASSVIFCTTTLVVLEMRQASADPLLTLCVTVSLWSWWCGQPGADGGGQSSALAQRLWRGLAGAAAGLGVLAKGPVALMLIGLPMVGHGVVSRRWRTLLDPLWWLAMLAVALPWPLVVVQDYPAATRRWWTELAIKLTAAGGPDWRLPLALRWVELVMPWALVATCSLAMPWTRGGRMDEGPKRRGQDGWWLVWWWCAGNLLAFSFWRVAKPSYYLPCLPAVALLAGWQWSRWQQESGRAKWHYWAFAAQWLLLALFAVGAATVALVTAARWWPVALALVAGALGCLALGWPLRRRPLGTVLAGAPHVLVVAAFCQWLLPSWNDRYSHKRFADRAAERAAGYRVPLRFMADPNESLWFYMERPPRRLGQVERVVRWLSRRRRPGLLVLNRREYRALLADQRVRLTLLEAEPPWHVRPGLCLARASLAGGQRMADRDPWRRVRTRRRANQPRKGRSRNRKPGTGRLQRGRPTPSGRAALAADRVGHRPEWR